MTIRHVVLGFTIIFLVTSCSKCGSQKELDDSTDSQEMTEHGDNSNQATPPEGFEPPPAESSGDFVEPPPPPAEDTTESGDQSHSE